MPSLRQLLNRPRVWLAMTVVLYALVAVDSARPPESQVAGWLYVKLVRLYQWGGRPILAGHVTCRFKPSCSEYSIGAVEAHGIWRGLSLTCGRLSRCNSDAPIGAHDPVP